MAQIIIEGPDGSGKSSTAHFLERAVLLPVLHAQGPPKTPDEIVKRVVRWLEVDNHIFDRYPLISEMVYGPIIRGHHIFDRSWLSRLDRPDVFVIYCRPYMSTLIQIKVKLTDKGHKPQDHVDQVIKKYLEVVKRYDKIMSYIPRLIHFNRDTHTLEDLCAELTSRMTGAEPKE